MTPIDQISHFSLYLLSNTSGATYSGDPIFFVNVWQQQPQEEEMNFSLKTIWAAEQGFGFIGLPHFE